MKLLYCRACGDIVALRKTPFVRNCSCGESGGQYRGGGYVEYTGKKAVVLGINDLSLQGAVAKRYTAAPEWGMPFEAFVISPEHERLKKI